MKILSRSLLLLAVYALPAFAEVEMNNVNLGSYKAHGGLDTDNSTFKNLTVFGGLDFKNLKVEGEAKIHGGAEGTGLEASVLNVYGGINGKNILVRTEAKIHGRSKLQHAVFQGEFTSHGRLHAKKSKFKEIMTASKKVILEDTEVTENIIFEITHNNEPQELHLKGRTIVHGNIEFISDKGKVYIENSARVLGTIKGQE